MKPKKLIIHIITPVAPSNYLALEGPFLLCGTGWLQYACWPSWGLCDWGWRAASSILPHWHLLQSDTVIWLWMQQRGLRERGYWWVQIELGKGTKKDRRGMGGGDLMMRVLSAPLRNGFSPAMSVYLSEVDWWWKGVVFTCSMFCLFSKTLLSNCSSAPISQLSTAAGSLLLHPLTPPFSTVMPHPSFLFFSSHFFPIQ